MTIDWTKCATISSSYSNENYRQLTQCPNRAGLLWKIENSNDICAETPAGWVDWEYPNGNEQNSLGFYLNNFTHGGWISPAMPHSNNCGIQSSGSWKDTTSVRAYQSSQGSVEVYYKGIEL